MRTLLLLLAAMALIGCQGRIEGETDTPPPAGGPPSDSAAHPPGERGEESSR
jgi:hypothetical protein